MEKLKPCPFCGGEAKIVNVGGTIYAACKACAASGPTKYCITDAEWAWNTRRLTGRRYQVTRAERLRAPWTLEAGNTEVWNADRDEVCEVACKNLEAKAILLVPEMVALLEYAARGHGVTAKARELLAILDEPEGGDRG